MKILNLEDIQHVSGGDFTVTIDLNTDTSAVGTTQSQAVAMGLGNLLASNPFDITSYFNSITGAGGVSSANIAQINITNITA